MTSHTLREQIHSELDRLQFGAARRKIAIGSIPIGLGGQITCRLDGLRLALALGAKAIFGRLADPPYTQVFQPMDNSLIFPDQEKWPPIDLNDPGSGTELYMRPGRFSTHDNGTNEQNTLRLICLRLNINSISSLVLDGIILDWLRLTDDVHQYCQAAATRLGVSSSTLGVHLRRGDKQVETAFVPASEVNRQILQMHNAWAFDSIFLASDDPGARDAIQLPTGVRLLFDDNEKRYNNANHKMLLANQRLAEQETLTAIKNIYLLWSCGGLIGQDNAHFATIAAAKIACHTNEDRISLINGRFSERRSLTLRMLFACRKKMRAYAKAIFPQLGLENRYRHKI